jgi:hypothetical protein
MGSDVSAERQQGRRGLERGAFAEQAKAAEAANTWSKPT